MSPRVERTPSPRPSGRLACLEAPKILAQRLAPGRAAPRRAAPTLEDPHLGRLRTEEEESDATTSESEEEAQRLRRAGQTVRALRARQRHRRVMFEATDTGQLTFLEHSAVMNNERYEKVLQKFLTWPLLRGVRLVEDSEVDDATVRWSNAMYLLGMQANLGETLLAALCHAAPEFGKFGSRKLPRFHRALKGWRRRTPARSRAPHTFSMWCSMAWELCARGHFLMALYILWCVCLYMRPSEPLGILRGDLQKPVLNVSRRWQLLLFPEERSDRSKTFAANDSIAMHCQWATWLPLTAEVLADGPKDEVVFNFTYPEFLVEWEACRKHLGLKMVPYEARHSGPSVDAAKGLRTRTEIKNRGRWASERSVTRYEQRARLVRSYNLLTAAQQARADYCEAHLGDMLLGRVALASVP